MSRKQKLFLWVPISIIFVLIISIFVVGDVARNGWQRDERMLKNHNDSIEFMVSDGKSGLWAATKFNGVSHYDGTSWTNYNTENSDLLSQYIESLAVDDEGKLWVGFINESRIQYFDGQNWSSLILPIDKDNVSVIAHDPQGLVWIGTERNGLFVYDGAEWTRYGAEDWGSSPDPVSILAVAFDQSGNTWIASRPPNITFPTPSNWNERYLAKYDGSAWQLFDDLPTINAITIDKDDNLWLGTDNGIRILTKDGEIEPKLNAHNVTSIAFSNEEHVWVGTTDRVADGVFVFNQLDGSIDQFRVENSGLASNRVSAIVVNTSGNQVWIGTDSGLSITSNIPVKSSSISYNFRKELIFNTVIFSLIVFVGQIWYWIEKSNKPFLTAFVRTFLMVSLFVPMPALNPQGGFAIFPGISILFDLAEPNMLASFVSPLFCFPTMIGSTIVSAIISWILFKLKWLPFQKQWNRPHNN